MRFNDTLSTGSRSVPRGQTDMKKLIVAFCNFVNVPKITSYTWELCTFLNCTDTLQTVCVCQTSPWQKWYYNPMYFKLYLINDQQYVNLTLKLTLFSPTKIKCLYSYLGLHGQGYTLHKCHNSVFTVYFLCMSYQLYAGFVNDQVALSRLDCLKWLYSVNDCCNWTEWWHWLDDHHE